MTNSIANQDEIHAGEDCACGGECDECKRVHKAYQEGADATVNAEYVEMLLNANPEGPAANAGKYGNPQCGDTGQYLPHGAGTGKGAPHAAAVQGGTHSVEHANHKVQKAAEDAQPESGDEDDFIDPDYAVELLDNAFVDQLLVTNQATQGDHVSGSPVNQRREPNMALKDGQRQELIQWITVNCDCWKGDGDADTLNEFADDKLVEIAKAGDKARKAELALNAAVRPYRVGKHRMEFDVETGRWTANAFPVKKAMPVAPGAVAPAADQGHATQDQDEEDYGPNGDQGADEEYEAAVPVKKKPMMAPAMNAQMRKAANLAEWFMTAPDEAGDNVEATWNEAVMGTKRERAHMIRNLSSHLEGEPRSRLQRELDRLNTPALRTMQLTRVTNTARPPVVETRGVKPDWTGAGGPPIYNAEPDDDGDMPAPPSAIRAAVVWNQQQHNKKYREPVQELTPDAAS